MRQMKPVGFDIRRTMELLDECDHLYRMPGGWQMSAWEPVPANPNYEKCHKCGIARKIEKRSA